MLKKKRIAAGIFLTFLLILTDQITKLAASHSLTPGFGVPVIGDIFQLYYLKNPGAAFGIFSNRTILFAVITLLLSVLMIYYYLRSPEGKKYHWIRMVFLLILSGGIGNMIDRIWHGYVIDFFYFKLIDFPVFNVADIFVCVGSVLGLLLMFFYYSEEELAFLFFKNNQKQM